MDVSHGHMSLEKSREMRASTRDQGSERHAQLWNPVSDVFAILSHIRASHFDSDYCLCASI